MKTRIMIALSFLLFAAWTSPSRASDADEINACLKHWGKTPFNKTSDFRVISAKVKVMGIGQNLEDKTTTTQPELILVQPAVTVMAKTIMSLQNKNGWYCLKGEVAVLGKMEINLSCGAHLTSSGEGATVMGSDEQNTGVTVLGSTTVTRVGKCDSAPTSQVE